MPTADAPFSDARVGPLSVLPGEHSHYLCLRPRASAKNGCPTGVPASQMSYAGETGGEVLTLWAGLLINTGAVAPLSSEVVMEVSASLIEHVGPALDLAVVERNHGRSLTKLA